MSNTAFQVIYHVLIHIKIQPLSLTTASFIRKRLLSVAVKSINILLKMHLSQYATFMLNHMQN